MSTEIEEYYLEDFELFPYWNNLSDPPELIFEMVPPAPVGVPTEIYLAWRVNGVLGLEQIRIAHRANRRWVSHFDDIRIHEEGEGTIFVQRGEVLPSDNLLGGHDNEIVV